MSADVVERTVTVPIEWVGTFAGSKCCRVTINSESVQLKVPKGTRGVRVGAMLAVRIERRDWYKITRMVFDMRNSTATETEERGEYRDGARDHFYFGGIS